MSSRAFRWALILAWSLAAVPASGFMVDNCVWGSGSALSPSQSQNQSTDAPSQDKKTSDASNVRLKIVVTNNENKPVGDASVYIRFNVPGGFLHKDKLAELSLKTNSDGSVKVPEVPTGKILIQVIAKGLHTYGKWYDIQKDQDTIEIKLDPAPHWY
jgi:hypothetical protein